ncbi:unnamed protein product [Microthlaspi erraticum]|uniref:Uncharacterized protein n=1 Tax=Microthlaspi erraticum TaxID=1685480 RepID=A0A6D2J0M4_9BRAS|nr:unnamed protein product [Microthlaspi erraticum]
MILLLLGFSLVTADDVSWSDDIGLKSPGCTNKFQMVKVLNWVDGVKGDYFTGLTAQLEASVPSCADQSVSYDLLSDLDEMGCMEKDTSLNLSFCCMHQNVLLWT